MVGFIRLGRVDLSTNRLTDISGLTWLKSLARLRLEANPLSRKAYRKQIPLIIERNGGLHTERRSKPPTWLRRLGPGLLRLLPWYHKTIVIGNGRLTCDPEPLTYWFESAITLALVAYVILRIAVSRRKRHSSLKAP